MHENSSELDEAELHDDLGLDEHRGRHAARGHRPRRLRGCFAVLMSLAVLAALIGGIAFGVGKGKDKLTELFSAPDYSGQGTGAVTVEITKGQTSDDIAKVLETKGVVKSAKAFERAARDDVRSRSIQAGTYQLRKEMSAKAALALLLNPASTLVVPRVSVPVGKTKTEAADLIQRSKAAKLPAGSVQKALAQPQSLGLPRYAHGNPEGFLYPGTYDLPKGATATSILRMMVAKYNATAKALQLEKVAAGKQLDPYQAVIVASIVQAETNRDEDYPKVARVIYNRLRAGMPLQMDSTIHYILGRDGGVFTTAEARRHPSPYNTYKHKNLPPGPINSPDAKTLRAALNPAAGGWLYFTLVDLDTGETAFASTGEEHAANVAKLQAWCQAHPGRCG